MRIFFLALVVIASQDVLAKCFESPSFYPFNKIYKTAAIGYFNQSKDKLTFNPLVCMNRKKCSIIDLSNFPQYKKGTAWNQVWEANEADNSNVTNLAIINSTENTFELAAILQKKNVEKSISTEKKFSDLELQKSIMNPSGYMPEEHCFQMDTTIMRTVSWQFYTDYLDPTIVKHPTFYQKKYKITYANEKMKGCGCEDLFDHTKKELNPDNYKYKIIGHYEKRGDKLFFVEELRDDRALVKYEHIRDIELVEKDKCNAFVNNFLGKHIFMSTDKEIDPIIRKLPYINACRSYNRVLIDK